MGTTIRFISKAGISAAIILLGVLATLLVGETRGLAVSDLPDTSVLALAATPASDVLYVSLTNETWPAGIYRSDDNGQTWQAVAPELNIAVSALAVDPANPARLYAGTSGGSLFKVSSLWTSDDGGRTWRRLVVPLPASPAGILPAVTSLAIDPRQPHLLYVATDGHGVYRYDLESNGYELLGDLSLRNARVKELVAGADGSLYALIDTGLFKSQGQAWQPLTTLPETPVSVAVAPADAQRLYVGTVAGGAYRSADGGRSWDWIGHGLSETPETAWRVTALAVAAADPDNLVAAVAHGSAADLKPGGVYQSRDGGQHWTRLAGPEAVATELTFNHGLAYAATTAGLVRFEQPAGLLAALPLLDSLSALNGVRLLILVLAVGLAGLALLNWEKWLAHGREMLSEK